jgi:anaerobic glycerol-3-phosphate dehydrogenase
VKVNQELRPIKENGDVIANNLFACGSVLGNCKPRHGNALAVLTGYRAGMIASKKEVVYAAR